MSYKDFIKTKVINDKTDIVDKPAINDWDKETSNEIIKPNYNGGVKDYNISLRDVISGINTSRHKLSGENVWLADQDGDLLPLPEWIGSVPGGPGNGGSEESKIYRLEMLSSNGNIIKDKTFSTTLKAVIYENNIDVTDNKNKKYFKWARFSGHREEDQIADAKWNLQWSEGAKEIPITTEDVNKNAMFQVQFVTDKESSLWIHAAHDTYTKLIKNRR